MRRVSWKGSCPQNSILNKSISLTQGLKGYYVFNGCGGNVPNLAGGTPIGTFSGTSWIQSIKGKTLSTPTNAYAKFAYVPTEIQISYPFSVACLINFYSVANYQVFAGNNEMKLTAGGEGYVGITLWQYNGIFYVTVGANTTYDASGRRAFYTATAPTMVAGNWYLLVASVKNNATASLYTNSIPHGAITASGTYTGNPVYNTNLGGIGLVDSAANKGNCIVANFAIWSRAISQQEIQRLYQDPYCMLAPKVQHSRFYSIPSTVINSPLFFGCNF